MKGEGLYKNVLGGARFSTKIMIVLMVAITIGYISGQIIRSNTHDSQAASTNITVENNNQTVTSDQGTTTIERTSEVTVKDSSATYGYVLSARISQNTLPAGTTVKVENTIAPSSPVALSSTPTTILTKTGNNATSAQGDTSILKVTITPPANIALGNYILDIEYSEEGYIVPQTTHGPMQKLTNANCPTTRGTVYDIRNNQIYYIQKIPNSGSNPTTGALMDLCWMETNLKYSGGGSWDSTAGYPDDRKTLTQRTTGQGDNTTAEYMDPGGNPDYTTPGPGTSTTPAFYGYLYNWCAAMGGQTNACNTTSTTGFNTAISICPSGWRLPGGGSTATANGNDFGKLNAAVNGGSTTSDQGLINNWLGVYPGFYNNALGSQGSRSYYWSSTVYNATTSYLLRLYGNSTGNPSVLPGTRSDIKTTGFAVRCVI